MAALPDKDKLLRNFSRCANWEEKYLYVIELGGQLPALAEEHRQGLYDALAAQVPLGRLGAPGEVGKAVAFLASDAASFINATELFVDGGMAQI